MPDAATSGVTEWLVWECSDAACRLRFPAAAHEAVADRCPRCGAAARTVRRLAPPDEAATVQAGSRLPFAALLDNVRSLFNVGSIFRSADGAGFRHLYLCGITPTPAHRKLSKTALGAEQCVAWSQHNNAIDLAHELLRAGWLLLALEESAAARSLWGFELPAAPVALVVGSEVTGVDPDLLALCHGTLAIPMYGCKRSLNVATAFGVAAVTIAHRAVVRGLTG